MQISDILMNLFSVILGEGESLPKSSHHQSYSTNRVSAMKMA